MSRRIVCFGLLLWLLWSHSLLGQTVRCPDRLILIGKGLETVDRFRADEVKITISDLEVRCSYSPTTRVSLPSPPSGTCSTSGELTAVLPRTASLPPPGFSRWRFDSNKSQLAFDRYVNGTCRYGPKSYGEVALISKIPPGHACELSASSPPAATCFERHLPCGPGRVNTTNFGVESCRRCPENAVSNGRQSQCTECPSGSAPNAQKNACEQCTEGLVVGAGRCAACAAGSVPDANHLSCVACSSNQISQAGNCVSCEAGRIPNAALDACVECGGNQVLQGRKCVACVNGFQPNLEHTSCISCGENEISSSGSCKSCGPGAVPDSEHNACTACRGEQVAEGGACVSCGIGTLPNAEHNYCYIAPAVPKH